LAEFVGYACWEVLETAISSLVEGVQSQGLELTPRSNLPLCSRSEDIVIALDKRKQKWLRLVLQDGHPFRVAVLTHSRQLEGGQIVRTPLPMLNRLSGHHREEVSCDLSRWTKFFSQPTRDDVLVRPRLPVIAKDAEDDPAAS
jgi:hypothetical protein